MQHLTITKEDGKFSGRYVAIVDGHYAVITYSKPNDGVMIVNHTGVPPAIGGRGIAMALTQHLIEDARALGFKIVPTCSYTAAQFRRHPEWADVLTKEVRSMQAHFDGSP